MSTLILIINVLAVFVAFDYCHKTYKDGNKDALIGWSIVSIYFVIDLYNLVK